MYSSILDLIKSAYKDNRKLAFGLSSVVVLLVIILVVVLVINRFSLAENHTKLETAAPSVNISDDDLDEDQISELHTVIEDAYGEELDGYEIADGELLEDGSWYVTTFSKPIDQWSSAEDIYRLVLHKTGSWQIAAGPELVLSYLEYPDIPKSVIYAANNL